MERRPYFGDRRWRDVELTPAGKDAYETLRDARQEALAALIADWTADEKAQLAAVVGRLGDAVRVHNLAVHERRLAAARERAGAPGSRGPRPSTAADGHRPRALRLLRLDSVIQRL